MSPLTAPAASRNSAVATLQPRTSVVFYTNQKQTTRRNRALTTLLTRASVRAAAIARIVLLQTPTPRARAFQPNVAMVLETRVRLRGEVVGNGEGSGRWSNPFSKKKSHQLLQVLHTDSGTLSRRRCMATPGVIERQCRLH